MNTATQNLENDHVNILRLIDFMERMIQAKSRNIEHFEKAVELIRNYADGLHHAKEENFLFPLMAKRGFSVSQGPVAVMLHDHEEGRRYVKGMTEGIVNFKEGNGASLSVIFENMQGYIGLLRNHIAKENNVLFRLADNAFSDNDQQELLTEFAKIESKGVCGIPLNDCILLIDKLESEYR
jgi:hemerythrin-like domain-containing protein